MIPTIFSALEMQRMLGHKRNEPIWLMMHKIRWVMSKMIVLEDLKSETINKEVLKSIEKTASILCDGYTGYSKLKEVIAKHQVVVEPDKNESAKVFSGVNRTIRNAKKVILGIHHNCINQQYVQNYLDEFAPNPLQRKGS